MMFLIAVFLFGSVCQLPVLMSADVGYDSSSFCTHDRSVEAFAAAYFTAISVEHGCDVVSGIEVTGQEGAKSEYDVVLDVLQKEGMCSAEWVAYTASQPFRFLEKVTLAYYLEKAAHSTGRVLLKCGLLDCSNSISLALDYFSLVRNASRGLDERKLESYQRGNNQGLVDLIHEHGLDLEDTFDDLGFSFYNEFSSSHQGGCTNQKN